MDRVKPGIIRSLVLAVLLMGGWRQPAAAAPASEPGDFSQVAALFGIGAGARPLAMGGAFVGVADDENALFYNPAGLAYLQRVGLTSFYSTQYEVITYGAFGIAGPGAGLGGLYLSSTGIPGAGDQSEILGDFDYTNLAGVFGAAGSLGPVAVGVRGKYLAVTSATRLENRLETVTGSGFSGDVAALVDVGPLRLGVLVENLLGQPIRYSTGTSEAWERRIRAGFGLRAGPLLLAADLDNLSAEPRYYHAGGELRFGPLALRAGITGSASSGAGRDLSAGVGVRLAMLQLDYAYLMPSELPDTHRVSLTVRF